METEAKAKERPIVMRASSVQAYLEGRKTQTRRIIKGAEDCETRENQYETTPPRVLSSPGGPVGRV